MDTTQLFVTRALPPGLLGQKEGLPDIAENTQVHDILKVGIYNLTVFIASRTEDVIVHTVDEMQPMVSQLLFKTIQSDP